uniref:GBF1-like tetratricopeptide repeats domain-containing protein n=2 Tax=Meloidogyne incognita group TaxID=654580 RepID=A0A915N1A4_MELJA
MSSATSLLSPPPRATSSPISALNLNSFSDSTAESLSINFARNKKAQMATRALFELVHNYGDNLREGWKNVLDCLIYLLRANLLPPKLLELEDFVDIRGIVTIKEKFKRPQIPKKEESGLFSWLGLSVSSISSETDLNKKQINEEEQQLCNSAISLISECHPEQIITDSRYLTKSAFTELINNIIHCSFAIAPIQSKTQQIDNQDDDSIVDLTFAAAALFPIKLTLEEEEACPQNFPDEVDPITRTEEAKIRTIQFTCKVLLGNITQFYRLKTFSDLFLRIFDLMDQFLEENDCSDLLAEVIQESLKNCILVCENFGVFQGPIEGLKAEVSGRLEALTVKHSNSANSKIAL